MERKIFNRLLATLCHFNLQTQLRVAGDWVRDKLLGKDCYDIDIALDNIMGTEFVDKVREYLLSIGEEAQGISDLKSGRIVTPLPPKATFLDDPLRVLRAIRFGGRFEFTLDEDLKVGAACGNVKDALAAKISRQRIETEVDLMISGNQPVKEMTHICDLTLFWIVFSLPPEFEPTISDGCER
ncbi:hypothetical protein HN51_021453 [Arachis hypogaea]